MSILNRFLSASHIITGHVVHGDKTGRQLGFPTANLELDLGKELAQKLEPGVYVCVSYIPGMDNEGDGILVSDKNEYADRINPKLKLSDNKIKKLAKDIGDTGKEGHLPDLFPYPGLLHFGPRSTFGETRMQWEVFLLDFDHDIYDLEMIVNIGEMVRPSVKFESVPKLVKQMEQDVRDGRELLFRG